jgi:Zn-dependent peptidase ImmA (M78 family)/DNA-binding XRE family transcriptional regulator
VGTKLNIYNLKIARDFRGIRQSELAKVLNFSSVSKLSKIENGLKIPTAKDLDLILKTLNFNIDFLKINFNSEIRNDFKYRSRKIGSVTKNEIEANLHISLNIIDRLINDEIDISTFNFKKYINDPINKSLDIKEIAHFFRSQMQINTLHEKELIYKIEQLGIIVLETEYSKTEDARKLKVDGTCAVTLSEIPVIFIRKYASNDRKKFTLAHELGHIVLHSFKINNRYSEKEMEEQANEFASEFLLPSNIVAQDLKFLNLTKLEMLKAKYGVSMGAILYKAKKLNSITENQHKYLIIEMSRKGWLREEPARTNLFLDSPGIMKDILKHYYNVLEYSDEDLSKKVNLNVKDFKQLKSIMFESGNILRIVK